VLEVEVFDRAGVALFEILSRRKPGFFDALLDVVEVFVSLLELSGAGCD
jgi:hypothetical protein